MEPRNCSVSVGCFRSAAAGRFRGGSCGPLSHARPPAAGADCHIGMGAAAGRCGFPRLSNAGGRRAPIRDVGASKADTSSSRSRAISLPIRRPSARRCRPPRSPGGSCAAVSASGHRRVLMAQHRPISGLQAGRGQPSIKVVAFLSIKSRSWLCGQLFSLGAQPRGLLG
jgi:hypothetical protein